MSKTQENGPPQGISRREFLRQAALAAGAGLLAACGASGTPGEGEPYRTATPFRALSSPQAGAQEGTAVPEGAITLEQFLALSSLLTGVDNLDPALGQIYLQAAGDAGLAEVYSAAAPGGSLAEDIEVLNQANFFEQEGVGVAADTILTMWYTGVYQQDGEDRVATYVDALAFKVLEFTKAPTVCGHFGFWAEEPRVVISPQVQYTPVPTPAGGS